MTDNEIRIVQWLARKVSEKVLFLLLGEVWQLLWKQLQRWRSARRRKRSTRA